MSGRSGVVASGYAAMLALFGCGGRPGQDPKDVDFVANLVKSMRHTLQLHAELRGRPFETLTEDDRAVLRNSTHYLAVDRAGLESGLRRLHPSTRRHKGLSAFLARWTHDKLEGALLASPSQPDGIDSDVKVLERLFPEDNWRTLFPLFRP